jgi:hypothetical protein
MIREYDTMEDSEEKLLLETYNKLSVKFSRRFDSYTVVKTVIKHRNFWKPEKVKTMLLAESHVYTTDDEVAVKLRYPEDEEFRDLPDEFVKLVYCLGYGESILAPAVIDNHDTWQYWKLFAACGSDNPCPSYGNILKKGTPYNHQRYLNKIRLLRTLQAKGVWLVDCSIVALYDSGNKPTPKVMSKIIPFCWDNYISKIVEKEKPGYIIVIGEGVNSWLGNRIHMTGIDNHTIPQPQKRNYDYNNAFRILQKICNR